MQEHIAKKNRDDDALAEQFRTGAESAFSEVYSRYHLRMFFFARRYVEEADAKDAVSEAFFQLWKKRSGFTDLAAILQYLFLATRSRCLNLIKHRAVRQDKEPEILRQLEQTDDLDPFHEQLKIELVQLIYSEVEKLPARTRQVFLLSFAQGLKPAEIAEQLQISVQTVSNQKLSAIKLLQEALGDQRDLLILLLLLCGETIPMGLA